MVKSNFYDLHLTNKTTDIKVIKQKSKQLKTSIFKKIDQQRPLIIRL